MDYLLMLASLLLRRFVSVGPHVSQVFFLIRHHLSYYIFVLSQIGFSSCFLPPLMVSCCFFFASRRRHTRSVSAFLLNRSSDLVILVVWFLLPRVARLMIHTPTAISIFVCLSMVQLMAVFISMRCTLCGHFLQVALTLILVVGYAIAAS